MRAGSLRHRVTIQRYELAVDESVEAVSGREFFASQQVQSEVTHKVTIRFRPGVAADMRIVYGGRVFGIVAPLPDNRGTRLVLMCREVSCE